MLKDRREGLVYLHWCALTAVAVAVYLCWVAFIRAWPSIRPVEGPNFLLYLLGVIVASFSVHIGGDDSNPRLGQMGLIESIPHTLHQLSRYVAVLLALAFLTRDGDLSRKFLLGYIVNMSLALTLANMYFPPIIAWFFFHENLMRTVLLADAGEVVKLHEMMASREHLGIKIVGWVGSGDTGEAPFSLPKLGAPEALGRLLRENSVSQVVISQHSFSPETGRSFAQCAEEAGCRVRFFLHVQRYFPDQPVSIEQEGAFTLMAAANEPLENPLNRLLKRSLDIAISLPVVLFVLPPLCVVVWWMQRRQSPGPLIHRQYRSGLDRKKFLILKFRTMHEARSAAALSRQPVPAAHEPRRVSAVPECAHRQHECQRPPATPHRARRAVREDRPHLLYPPVRETRHHRARPMPRIPGRDLAAGASAEAHQLRHAVYPAVDVPDGPANSHSNRATGLLPAPDGVLRKAGRISEKRECGKT
jgi:Bacterial sugar transferase/CoA-binding domain